MENVNIEDFIYTKHSLEQFINRVEYMFEENIYKGYKWLKQELLILKQIKNESEKLEKTAKFIHYLIVNSKYCKIKIEKKQLVYIVGIVGLEFVCILKQNYSKVVLTTNIRIGKKYNDENKIHTTKGDTNE